MKGVDADVNTWEELDSRADEALVVQLPFLAAHVARRPGLLSVWVVGSSNGNRAAMPTPSCAFSSKCDGDSGAPTKWLSPAACSSVRSCASATLS